MKIITDDRHYHTKDILKILNAKWQLFGELNNKRAKHSLLRVFNILLNFHFVPSLPFFLGRKILIIEEVLRAMFRRVRD